MDGRPKRSLSLKKQSQKRLNFSSKVQSSGASPAHHQALAPEVPASASSAWLSGLCNLGNTCYANSILQVLRFCPEFRQKVALLSELLLKGTGGCSEEEEWQESKGALIIHLHRIWQRMADKEKTSASKSCALSATRPQKFISKFRESHSVFDNKMQQDAQEMLRSLLTTLHEILLEVSPPCPPQSSGGQATPTRNGVDVIDVDAYVFVGELVTRKRKLSQSIRRQKTSKTSLKKSASCSKVSDYFLKNAAPEPQHTKQGEEEEEEEEVAAREETMKASDETRSFVEERTDFVKEMFEGELISQTRCYECDGCTRRSEPFLDVSLAVSCDTLPGFTPLDPADPTPDTSGSNLYNASPGSSNRPLQHPHHTSLDGSSVGSFSLFWALSQFCLREKLAGENKYHCDGCGRLAEAERSLMFGRLPAVLTLHLNRFAARSSAHSGLVAVSKVGGNIAVPLTLRLSKWCTVDCARRDHVFQLVAVVFHTGSSCSTGHYVACVRGKECKLSTSSPAVAEWIARDSQWVEFDDEAVSLMTQQDLLDKLSPLTPSSTAYILFYH